LYILKEVTHFKLKEVTHFNNSNVPRVTFGRSKMKEKAPSSATTKLIVQNPGMDDDQADFFSEGSD
jgi:hypothetical protein